MDRKEFFSHAFKLAASKGLQVLEQTKVGKALEKYSEEPDSSSTNKHRPPGASHSDEEFLQSCTGCDACMAACPVSVIFIEDLEKRDPLIYSDQEPCIHCPGYPCIVSCPTGALSKENGLKLSRALPWKEGLL
ncbi:MAG: NAD(P)H-quinone oxidoreductase subunit I, chloroplastic [Chlamydiae bacterium]|nr:NAD(P)H-quinone oxidoreductase subunit I, chloroplastic [Chlamydiota bacterium]